MTRPKKSAEKVPDVDWEGEHFTYRSIWHAANVLREAREKDQANGFWSLMGATLLAYTAFEGFLNHGALGFMVWRTASRGRGGCAVRGVASNRNHEPAHASR